MPPQVAGAGSPLGFRMLNEDSVSQMDWLKLLGYLVFSAPGVALVAFGAALGGFNLIIIFLTPLLGAYLLGRSHGAEALMKVIKASMKEPPPS